MNPKNSFMFFPIVQKIKKIKNMIKNNIKPYESKNPEDQRSAERNRHPTAGCPSESKLGGLQNPRILFFTK